MGQPGFPGWGYVLGRGATTVWERWDGIRTDGSFNDPGMNSFNHYGLGSVGDFLYRQVGGLSAGSPGYRSLIVAPKPGGGLSSARSAMQTPYGQAISDWTSSGEVFTLRVTVPAGSSATVRGSGRLSGGRDGARTSGPVRVQRRCRKLLPARRKLHLHRAGLGGTVRAGRPMAGADVGTDLEVGSWR